MLRKTLCFLMLGAVFTAPIAFGANPNHQVLVIVLDGLRPDYVTEEVMPNVHVLAREGVVGLAHHASFPTVTRVNASSISTGAYPGGHGVMGNSVYFPEVNPKGGISTGSATNLMRIQETIAGRLWTTSTLGEILESKGMKLAVVSSGSPGSAYCLNPYIAGGAVLNVEMVLPEAVATEISAQFGDVPAEGEPNLGQNQRAVDMYLDYVLPKLNPAATIIWLSDPDHTAHAKGMGDPVTVASLTAVDGEVGRILDTLETRGLRDATNILIVSDHGFATYGGDQDGTLADPAGLLIAKGLKEGPDSTDVVEVNGAIYVNEGGDERVKGIVNALQKQPWTGPLFTRAEAPGSDKGWVPGTLSFDLIHFDHERAPDVMFSPRWTDAVNEHGYAGYTMAPGLAGHGSASLHEVRATLIAAGPDIRKGRENPLPTANVDVAPTVAYLLGIDYDSFPHGRVMKELMNDGPDPDREEIIHEGTIVSTPLGDGGEFKLFAHTSRVGGSRYFDYATVME